MDTGIGVDGYSLIGQGKIADIISGKPESRREIFEEAAGIVKYRSKKADTERKLAAASSNLERVSDIISDLEQRITPLKEEAQKANRYLELSARYKEMKTSLILKDIENAEASKRDLKYRMKTSDDFISSQQKEKETLDGEIMALKERAEQLDAEELEERDRMMRFSDEIGKRRSEFRLSEEKRESLRSSIHIFENETKMLEERFQKEHALKEEYCEKRDIRRAELKKTEERLNEKNDRFIRDSISLKESEARAEEDRSRLYELSMKLSAKSAEISGLENLINSLSERKNEIEDVYKRQVYSHGAYFSQGEKIGSD